MNAFGRHTSFSMSSTPALQRPICVCQQHFDVLFILKFHSHCSETDGPPPTASLDAGRGGQNCDLCDLGTYSAGFTRNDCQKCPGDLTTLVKGSISESACTCPPGYGIPLLRMMGTIDTCSVCPPNTYSNPLPTAAVPDRTCQLCPANYTSPTGSASINACGKLLLWR